MFFGAEQFVCAWSLWQNKGHKPSQKLSIYESRHGSQVLYSIGILDYVTLENIYFASESLFTNYEAAFADIGRALDKFLNVEEEKQDESFI